MFEPPARRLAVATLTEAGNIPAFLRGPDGWPLQGHVLVTGEGPDCRITVYIDQGAGTQTAVLAGEMVWLGAEPEPAPVASPAAAGATGAEPWAGLLSGAGSPAVASASSEGPGPATPDARREPMPEPEPEPEPESTVGFKLYPEPAVPVSALPPHKIEVTVSPVEAESDHAPAPEDQAGEAAAAPDDEPRSVPLGTRHPLAPRAGGSVRLDFAAGRVTLTARGLPSPALLSRSCNAYRAWLLNQRLGTRHPLGLLTRAWGENYRLESEGDQPLSRYDAVLVTAEDRSSESATAAPQVLLGDYRQP